jgi:hypothetical protein
MLKKVGLATLALAGLLAFVTPKAEAGVRFGIGVGVAPTAPVVPAVPVAPAPPYADPYAYPYAYDYPYPTYGTYAYPYVAPSLGFGFGWGGHAYQAAPVYRGGVEHGFHGGGFHGGRR